MSRTGPPARSGAPSSIDRARAALASRDFRRLLLARLLSQFADGLFQAFLVDRLVFLSPESQSTAIGVTKAFAVLVIPFSVLGPLAGVFIDRWSRRGILVRTPLVRAAATALLLPFGHANWVLYALALIVVSADRFFLTTAGAVMPVLVPDEDLLVGNALNTTVGTTITFVGLLAGTQLADVVHPAGLLMATVVAWPVASILAARISNPLQAVRPDSPLRREMGRVARGLVHGVRRLGATPAALGSVVSITVDQILVGVVIVLSLVVFKEEFKQGVASYGRIVGAGGLGVLLGATTVGWLEHRMRKTAIVGMAFALAGLVTVSASLKLGAPEALAVSFVLGLTFPWRKIPADTIVQESIPDRYRGRVFALYDVGFSMARVLAAFITALVLHVLSVGTMVLLVGLVYLAWTPVLGWWVRRSRWVTVRFYAGGRAEEIPRAVVIAGEEEPVEVINSALEERDGVRVRTLRLRTPDGTVLDLVEGSRGDRWLLTNETVPERLAAPGSPV
jgi:MFS family permease